MTNELNTLKTTFHHQLEAAKDLEILEQLRVEFFGKKGQMTVLVKGLGAMDPDLRRTFGAELNQLRDDLTALFEEKRQSLETLALEAKLAAESIDITLPPRPEREGSIHPISQTIDELIDIFARFGFRVADGPSIEDEFHNFTALNFPDDHPAMDEHDTFYFKEFPGKPRKLLRTHTSPVQIRTMLTEKPPIYIIAPGRTYRCDDDATHTPNFHQIEGLAIGKDLHMGHLKGLMVEFCQSFFGVKDLKLRFRPSFFPFTEPSAEVDVSCHRERGKLLIGQGTDWLEIFGCGMVHPNVLRNCGIDPTIYQGFAFGMGIERIAMLRYGIPDLRDFYAGETRWLRHYGFKPTLVPSLAMGLKQ